MPLSSRPSIEKIEHEGSLFALIVYKDASATETTFLTGSQQLFQAGFVVYPKGGAVAPHLHKEIERQIKGTSEAILVRSGSCFLDLFDGERRLFATRDLQAGDLVLLYHGGHGFRMTEDCVLFEIKQGPYSGLEEKERFAPNQA